MERYELYDKYLTGDLSEEETDLLVEILEDEEAGRELVEYSLETKLFIDYGKKVKSKIVAPVKTSGFKKAPRRRSYLPVLMIAAILSLAFLGYHFFNLKNNAVITDGSSVEVSRNGILSTSGKKISEGDTVRAIDDCNIDFEDGSSLKLRAGSKIIIQELVMNKSIVLQKGKLFINAKPQEMGAIKVITDDSVTEVVGTEFSVQKLTVGTVLEVEKGTVKFSNSEGVVEVPQGKLAFTAKGNPIDVRERKSENSLWDIFSDRLGKDESLKFYTNFKDGKHEGILTLGSISQDEQKRFFLHRGIIAFPESENFIAANEITLFSWVRIEEYSMHAPVFTKGDDSWRLQIQHGLPHVGYGGTSVKSFLDTAPKHRLNFRKWYLVHQVITQDNVKIYVDGQKLLDEKVSNVSFEGTGQVMIGGNSDKKNYHFLGDIGEAGLFNRALTDEEIQEMYEFGKFRN
ncbi:MAG: FecR domain-containing protein [Lentisphaeraceae bacterium]|nr:FecR domain-containing protein [Lentisphaeraceae bacterium]